MRIAVIPARGGSRRIPRKNIRYFHGKPIIAYSIEAAWASCLFKRVIVSTDDEEIAEVATKYQALPFMRSPALGHDSAGTLEVTGEVARQYQDATEVCCIYATAPMLRPADLVRAHGTFVALSAEHCIALADHPLRSAAMFYWSRAGAARSEAPYWGYATIGELIPSNRVCDINVESDWQRAERMYAALMETTHG